jgi:hypothetical protein
MINTELTEITENRSFLFVISVNAVSSVFD